MWEEVETLMSNSCYRHFALQRMLKRLDTEGVA